MWKQACNLLLEPRCTSSPPSSWWRQESGLQCGYTYSMEGWDWETDQASSEGFLMAVQSHRPVASSYSRWLRSFDPLDHLFLSSLFTSVMSSICTLTNMSRLGASLALRVTTLDCFFLPLRSILCTTETNLVFVSPAVGTCLNVQSNRVNLSSAAFYLR